MISFNHPISNGEWMGWKDIEDITIICKNCNQLMVLESLLNNSNGIFVCPECNEHINLVSMSNGGVWGCKEK